METGLHEAYFSFNVSAASFLENTDGLDSSGPASKDTRWIKHNKIVEVYVNSL